MWLYILTHPRELERKTNTGSLVLQVLRDSSKLIVWERTKPDAELLAKIEEGSVGLVYPTDGSETLANSSDLQHFIILDGTWQEARKIYNRSPYLQTLKKVTFNLTEPSIYNLRRNQKENGLCTAECAVELMKIREESLLAGELQLKLSAFLSEST